MSTPYAPATYRYTDPVTQAMQASHAVPARGSTPVVHGKAGCDTTWFAPRPLNQVQMRQLGARRIRNMQLSGRLPNPYPEPEPASASTWCFFGPACVGATPVGAPLPACAAHADCPPEPSAPAGMDGLEEHEAQHTRKRVKPKAAPSAAAPASPPGVADLLQLFQSESGVQVTLSAALQARGAKLEGSWILVAWDAVPRDIYQRFFSLHRPGDRYLFSPMRLEIPTLIEGDDFELLPMTDDYRSTEASAIRAVHDQFMFLRRLEPLLLPEPEWLQHQGVDAILAVLVTAMQRADQAQWPDDMRDALRQLDLARDAAFRRHFKARDNLNAHLAQDLRARMAQGIRKGKRIVFCHPKVVEKLAPAIMKAGRAAVIAPPHMNLVEGRPGGFLRQLDYLLGETSGEFRSEQWPLLLEKRNANLNDGLLIILEDDHHYDHAAQTSRRRVLDRYFAPSQDRLLYEGTPRAGFSCYSHFGVPEANCEPIDHVPSVDYAARVIEQSTLDMLEVARQMRLAGLSGVPSDHELRLMGPKDAKDHLSDQLATAHGKALPQKDGWESQLERALDRAVEALREVNVERERNFFFRIVSNLQHTGTTWLSIGAAHVKVLGQLKPLTERIPAVVLRHIR